MPNSRSPPVQPLHYADLGDIQQNIFFVKSLKLHFVMELLQSFWIAYSGSNVGAQKNQQNSPFCDGNRFSWGIVWSLVFHQQRARIGEPCVRK